MENVDVQDAEIDDSAQLPATQPEEPEESVAPERAKREPVSRRGQQTRANLIDSGRLAIVDGGLDALRVDDVVTRAGTSHGTFYLYFANIDELVDHIAMVCDNEMATLLTEAMRVESTTAQSAQLVHAAAALQARFGDLASPWAQTRTAEARLRYLHEQVATSVGPADVASTVKVLSVLVVLDRLVPSTTARAVGIESYHLRQHVAQLIGQLLS